MPSNVPELSVSELAFALKKTLEDTYGRVRVRGELSRVKIHSSGHLYSDLKDDGAVLNIVCWKGNCAKLSLSPEEGLEVICTGRLSSYPQRSNYQLIVETMEPAGEGALLKLLEDRRRRLAAEGLFAPERKRKLPFLPQVIGVVTSPTGAVISDIMHRLDERFPRHVLLWPVAVQGQGAAEQVAAAIRGFDALPETGGKLPRPDLLIVARGGGSLEDLMAFNEEIVVRAAADCRIPLISAVGHETDTTLIDFAADHRAPTPTAAAERAVPERAGILNFTGECGQRLHGVMARLTGDLRNRLAAQAAHLRDPGRLLELRTQRADHVAQALDHAFRRRLDTGAVRLSQSAGRLRHPRDRLREAGQRLAAQERALAAAAGNGWRQRRLAFERRAVSLRPPAPQLDRLRHRLERQGDALTGLKGALIPARELLLAQSARVLETLSYKSVLARGFAVVRDGRGMVIDRADKVTPGEGLDIEFADGRRQATADKKGRA